MADTKEVNTVLKKARTCGGCKALVISNSAAECTLGFGINKQKTMVHFFVCVPKTRCYKPRTYREFIEAQRLIDGAI